MDIAPRWSDFEFGLHSSKSSSDNQEDDDKEKTGMEEAFESLNELKSLDGNVGTTPIQSSEAFTSMDSEIRFDLTQDEINLYKDMYEELESGSGNEIYGDILGELTDNSSKTSFKSDADNSSKTSFKSDTSSSVVPLDDIDGIGSIQKSSTDDDDDSSSSSSSVIDQFNVEELSQDTDKFMRKALEEALDEAKIQGGEGSINNVVDESILNDEEFIKEINAVFDRANEKLLESIASIKKEQDQLSKASAQSRSRVLEEDEARLREAEGSVVRLVEKVKQETLEVERAVKELEEAQKQMGGDPLMKAADLKKAGIVKQGALVGAILFSFRSVGELFLVAQQQGDVEGHSAAAAIQAFIALACGGYMLFF
jgi:nucleotide-binding universal stress UspA family protein